MPVARRQVQPLPAAFCPHQLSPCRPPVYIPLAGGLSYNDFVLAAKINALDLRQYTVKPRTRFWA